MTHSNNDFPVATYPRHVLIRIWERWWNIPRTRLGIYCNSHGHFDREVISLKSVKWYAGDGIKHHYKRP